MKMKTGPKVLLFALVFVALGFWAGRGFPRTWEAFLQSGRSAATVQADPSPETHELSRRLTDLERRVDALEGAARPPLDAAAPEHEGPVTPDIPLEAPKGSL